MTSKLVILYIMGVSGAGKTTVGERLGEQLNLPFYDGDDFHPQANVAKMRAGQPLNDADRREWLAAIHQFAQARLQEGQSAIIACSALKQAYRDRLSEGMASQVRWIYLEASYALIRERLEQRRGHFMPPSLLPSQFETLEPPADALRVDAGRPLPEILSYLQSELNLD
jgi:carbohydrate kinase (thermoresistant glucokinase family)